MNLKKYIAAGSFVILSVIATAQTPRIRIAEKGLYPEGTAFNPAANKFFLSCVIDGTIGTVDMQGNYAKFYEDKGMKSTYGMKVDSKRNRLWICVSDANYSQYSDSASFRKTGRLIALDLNSGKKVADVDLAKLYKGKHFINDIVLDNSGNIYATDSFSPVIYKIDAAVKATVFAQSDVWKGEDIGLNGITYNPQGYLLVDDGRTGSVYKVSIKNPKDISRVKTDQFFPGADGLLMSDNNTLVLIQNKGVDKVFQLESTDNWQSAKLKAATSAYDRFQQPSTGTMANGKLYVLNSKLNELADPTKKPSKEFSLQLVEWKPAM